MKKRCVKLVTMLLIALAISALAGCGGKQGTPTGVAESFLNALIAHNAGDSYGLLSDKFKNEWAMATTAWHGMMVNNPIPKDATYKVKGENIQGDTATVTITTGTGGQGSVKLVKENGSWHVDYELSQWYGLAP